ncbi:mechanosensitive ion channel family protein [Enterococcus cecorum]|uniref:mechanosensitive ion channel family protein n=1 Tax=Enterococcus cecorum TaxID=44008 RepID=UPI001FAC0428|nr:mechanosensitive ion channel family protein [Enterococcus cecorum]MCJ0536729.1 mechanosensitive ion channel family protein [Enterococcus cecorum]MCJ0544913.1 mechanosensitive ion channel family protein [Enterococcus cecorum]MCJ0550088.1 mechanosensitive ion channel family protein [Enterococcus cecorum]MCJ0569353.1 mechanosensitive ion channel family protein [Enterococcus cecorum]
MLATNNGSVAETTEKQLNALQRWWHNINWENIINTIVDKAIGVVLLTLLFFILQRLSFFLLDRVYKQYSKRYSMNENRLNTIKTLMHNIIQYTLGFFYVYSLLSVLGFPIGSLLAGAGIAGIAIGLGAQGFMNDIITGAFIIMEQQIDVGNYIRLPILGIEGTVMSVGIRTLQLKSTDGTLHYVPNRNITVISNTSRENMQVLVDVRINPNEGIEEMKQIITTVNQEFAQVHHEVIETPPSIFGVVDLGNNNFAIRSIMYVSNGQQFSIKQAYLTACIDALVQNGYTIPNTPIITK